MLADPPDRSHANGKGHRAKAGMCGSRENFMGRMDPLVDVRWRHELTPLVCPLDKYVHLAPTFLSSYPPIPVQSNIKLML